MVRSPSSTSGLTLAENWLNDDKSTVHYEEVPLDCERYINSSVYGENCPTDTHVPTVTKRKAFDYIIINSAFRAVSKFLAKSGVASQQSVFITEAVLGDT